MVPRLPNQPGGFKNRRPQLVRDRDGAAPPAAVVKQASFLDGHVEHLFQAEYLASELEQFAASFPAASGQFVFDGQNAAAVGVKLDHIGDPLQAVFVAPDGQGSLVADSGATFRFGGVHLFVGVTAALGEQVLGVGILLLHQRPGTRAVGEMPQGREANGSPLGLRFIRATHGYENGMERGSTSTPSSARPLSSRVTE